MADNNVKTHHETLNKIYEKFNLTKQTMPVEISGIYFGSEFKYLYSVIFKNNQTPLKIIQKYNLSGIAFDKNNITCSTEELFDIVCPIIKEALEYQTIYEKEKRNSFEGLSD